MDNFLEFVKEALPENWEKLTKEEKIDILIGILDKAKVQITEDAVTAKNFAEYEAERAKIKEENQKRLDDQQKAWGEKLK